jgi:hypothetical protein
MKTVIKIFVSIFLASAVIGIVSCTASKPVTTEIAVLRDITDRQIAQPELTEIMSLFNFSENFMWNGAIFHFGDLSDISYTPKAMAKIEVENEWSSNELARKKKIEKFKNEMKEILSNADTDSAGKNHSSIYLPIARELNMLSKSSAQKRVLLVYSDLMENDMNVSLYSKENFQMLQSNPGDFKKLLEKRLQIQSLYGVEVHFLYQPENILEDEQFKFVSEFYKNLLEEKGAQVTISANLSI